MSELKDAPPPPPDPPDQPERGHEPSRDAPSAATEPDAELVPEQRPSATDDAPYTSDSHSQPAEAEEPADTSESKQVTDEGIDVSAPTAATARPAEEPSSQASETPETSSSFTQDTSSPETPRDADLVPEARPAPESDLSAGQSEQHPETSVGPEAPDENDLALNSGPESGNAEGAAEDIDGRGFHEQSQTPPTTNEAPHSSDSDSPLAEAEDADTSETEQVTDAGAGVSEPTARPAEEAASEPQETPSSLAVDRSYQGTNRDAEIVPETRSPEEGLRLVLRSDPATVLGDTTLDAADLDPANSGFAELADRDTDTGDQQHDGDPAARAQGMTGAEHAERTQKGLPRATSEAAADLNPGAQAAERLTPQAATAENGAGIRDLGTPPAGDGDQDGVRRPGGRELRAQGVDDSNDGSNGGPPDPPDPSRPGDRGDRPLTWSDVADEMPSDRTGRPLRAAEAEHLGLKPEQIRWQHDREAPLGQNPEQFREFRSSLFDALRQDGIASSDVDVRLQGSSAHGFSGNHKEFLPRPGEKGRDYVDSPEGQSKLADWPAEPADYPANRPFDAAHKLGFGDLSDYDVQISSDAMIDKAAAVHAAAGRDPETLFHPKYGFLDKESMRDSFPALDAWKQRWEQKPELGREVNPAVFGPGGPTDTSSSGVSSHFQDSDWIITSVEDEHK